jgi:hypothetical protein
MSSDMWEDQLSTTIHELLHALGFSEWMTYDFPTYKPSHFQYTTVDGVDRFRIKTPKVLERAAEHFGCPTASYIEMEN